MFSITMGLYNVVISTSILLFMAIGINTDTNYRRESVNTAFKDESDLFAHYKTFKVRASLNFNNANLTKSEGNELSIELIDPCVDSNGISYNCDKRTSYCDEGVHACGSCATTCSSEKMNRWPDVRADCERVKMCAIYLVQKDTEIAQEQTREVNKNPNSFYIWIIVIMAIVMVAMAFVIGILLHKSNNQGKVLAQEQIKAPTKQDVFIGMSTEKQDQKPDYIFKAPQYSASGPGQHQKLPVLYSQETQDTNGEKVMAYNKSVIPFSADIVEGSETQGKRVVAEGTTIKECQQNTVSEHMTETKASQPLLGYTALSSSSSGISTSSE